MYNDIRDSFTGRIADIQDGVISVFDGRTAMHRFSLPQTADLRHGDIVAVKPAAHNALPYADGEIISAAECRLICRSEDNPFSESHSLPSRFLREGLYSVLKARSEFMRITADFFDNRDYTRMESPVLVDSPGVETYLEPFATDYYDYESIAHRMYLPTSPEYALKAAAGAMLASVYSFARSFRNCGEESALHKKEFTMLEWYIVYRDYRYMIDETQRLLSYIGEHYQHDWLLRSCGRICDLHRCDVWTMRQLFGRFNIELDNYTDNPQRFIDDVLHHYEASSLYLPNDMNKDDYFFKFFMDFIEPDLGFDRPAIVKDFPMEMCPLSVPVEDAPCYGQRFEVYIFGIEIANGYTELTDYATQRANFERVLSERQAASETVNVGMPREFLQTLRYGVPPCTGCAMGLDRMFMLCGEFDDVHNTDWY